MPRPRKKEPPLRGWSISAGGKFLAYLSADTCRTAAEAEARLRRTLPHLPAQVVLDVRPVRSAP